MTLLILTVLLVVGTVLSNCYLSEISPKLALAAESARTHNVKCVYDIMHEYAPNLSHLYRIYDALLLPFLIPLIYYAGDYDFYAFVKDFLWLIVPVLAFRCLTICASVPTATIYEAKRDFGTRTKQLLTGSDQDLNFSGHVALATALVLIMFKRKIVGNRLLWMGALLGYGLFSTMSRSHFTGDVIWAFVTVFCFYDFTFCQSGVKSMFIGGCLPS